MGEANAVKGLICSGDIFMADPTRVEQARGLFPTMAACEMEAAAVAHVGRQPRSRAFNLLIAATAHAHDARLYTRNAADLVGLDDLLDIVAL